MGERKDTLRSMLASQVTGIRGFSEALLAIASSIDFSATTGPLIKEISSSASKIIDSYNDSAKISARSMAEVFSKSLTPNSFGFSAKIAAGSLIEVLEQSRIADTVARSSTLGVSTFAESLQRVLQSFDLGQIEVSEKGNLVYDGCEYSEDELTMELDSQIELINNPKTPKTLKENFELLKRKIWLILLILHIYTVIPDFVDKTSWYKENIPNLTALFKNHDQEEREHCAYVIKEKAILRKNADPTSSRVAKLLYDTRLKIIADIPRWYEVVYEGEDGNVLRGWISKVSVEETWEVN